VIAGRWLINEKYLPALHISVVKNANGNMYGRKYGSVSSGDDFRSLPLFQFSFERVGKIDFNQSYGCLLVQVKTAVMRNK
jgi:hypothetical protein